MINITGSVLTEPRALLHALRHYALQAEIILVDFNLAVSTQTDKPPNLIPHQIFWLYSMYLPSCAVQWYILSVTVVHLIFTVVHFIVTVVHWDGQLDHANYIYQYRKSE